MKIVEVKSKNGTNFMILDGNNEPIVDAVRYESSTLNWTNSMRIDIVNLRK